MGELQTWGEITDRRDRRNAGPPVLVDEHEAALGRDARFFVTEPGRERSAAHRHEQELSLDCRAVLKAHAHACGGLLDVAEPGAEVIADAPSAEGPLEQLRA